MREWDLGFDLDKLQAFYAVTRLGGVVPAAKALGRSQPAISHRLRALSDGLGVALFEKVGRRLKLTPAGEELAARCAELFAMTRGLHAATTTSDGGVRGVVAIGTYATVASHLLVPHLEPLLAAHPELALRFAFGLGTPLLERLRAGELDVVLVAGTQLRNLEGLSVTPLSADRMIAVAAPGLLPPRTPRLAALRATRYLAWEGDDETFGKVRAFAMANGLFGATTLTVPHLESLRRMAVRGIGWTVLPRYAVVEDLASRALIDLELAGLDATLDFHVLVRARAVVTPAVRAVLDVVERLRPGRVAAPVVRTKSPRIRRS